MIKVNAIVALRTNGNLESPIFNALDHIIAVIAAANEINAIQYPISNEISQPASVNCPQISTRLQQNNNKNAIIA